MQNHMRAQWVCSRERRIALYKRSSIKNKQTNKQKTTATKTNKQNCMPSVKRKEKRTKHRSRRNATKKGAFLLKDLWPAWQAWWESIKSRTIQADFCMKSLEEQRVIKNVKGSTQIKQCKNSIVSSIKHYQQIVQYAKEGRLGAMTMSVRRLKLDMQTVCVEVCLQLVGNRSLKDLGQIG